MIRRPKDRPEVSRSNTVVVSLQRANDVQVSCKLPVLRHVSRNMAQSCNSSSWLKQETCDGGQINRNVVLMRLTRRFTASAAFAPEECAWLINHAVLSYIITAARPGC